LLDASRLGLRRWRAWNIAVHKKCAAKLSKNSVNLLVLLARRKSDRSSLYGAIDLVSNLGVM